jgi:uncharacterized protein involved in type VI secretion and phage assembly
MMLRDMVAPVRQSGDVIIPNFGGEADVRVDWKPDEPDRPVVATALFDDRSTRMTSGGERIPMPRRRMRLTLRINGSLTLVTDATLTPV